VQLGVVAESYRVPKHARDRARGGTMFREDVTLPRGILELDSFKAWGRGGVASAFLA